MPGSDKSAEVVVTVQPTSSKLEREESPSYRAGQSRDGHNRSGDTQRGLKSRHIQFIALGGCVGTGLFVGTGAILSVAGGANLFLAFVVMSMIVWSLMNSLAEMTSYLPVSGVSVPFYTVSSPWSY